MKPVFLYSLSLCPFCIAAKAQLEDLGIEYEEIVVDNRPDLWNQMIEHSGGGQTAPQIFVGEKCIGGYDDMQILHQKGLLMPMIEKQP